MRIGFVGAGRMGRPMVDRLAAAGHEVQVLVRSEPARKALAGDGLRVVADAAGVAEGADAVVVCVFSDDQLREVCIDAGLPARMREGSVLIVHTTGSPRTVETIAGLAEPYGVQVLDAPVSGGPHDVAAGRITLFVGGAAPAVARVRPVLDAYGDPVLHVGPLGAGQRVKLVNNALFAAQIGLLSEAVRLGARLGVDEAALLDALPHASSASRAMSGAAGRGSVAAFAAVAGDFIGKDVAVARAVSAELGAGLGLLDDAIDAIEAI